METSGPCARNILGDVECHALSRYRPNPAIKGLETASRWRESNPYNHTTSHTSAGIVILGFHPRICCSPLHFSRPHTTHYGADLVMARLRVA